MKVSDFLLTLCYKNRHCVYTLPLYGTTKIENYEKNELFNNTVVFKYKYYVCTKRK